MSEEGKHQLLPTETIVECQGSRPDVVPDRSSRRERLALGLTALLSTAAVGGVALYHNESAESAVSTSNLRADGRPGNLFGNPKIPDGSSIQCYGSEGVIYRWTDGERRIYPNDDVARSWDQQYDTNVQTVDCTDIDEGAPMQPKEALSSTSSTDCEFPAPPGRELWGNPRIPDGGSIQCYGNEGVIYRWTSNTRRIYPSVSIARSWDPQYDSNVANADCTDIEEGSPMMAKCGAPEEIPARDVEKPNDTPPTQGQPSSYCELPGSPGENLFGNPKIPDGASIQCYGSEGTFYRWTAGVRRQYPSNSIAKSWDPMFAATVQSVDCTDISEGSSMAAKCGMNGDGKHGEPIGIYDNKKGGTYGTNGNNAYDSKETNTYDNKETNTYDMKGYDHTEGNGTNGKNDNDKKEGNAYQMQDYDNKEGNAYDVKGYDNKEGDAYDMKGYYKKEGNTYHVEEQHLWHEEK